MSVLWSARHCHRRNIGQQWMVNSATKSCMSLSLTCSLTTTIPGWWTSWSSGTSKRYLLFVLKFLLCYSEVPGLQRKSRKRKASEPGPEIVERHEQLLDEIYELRRQRRRQHGTQDDEEENHEPEEQPPTRNNNNNQDRRSRDESQPEDEDDTGSPVPRSAIHRPRFNPRFRVQSPPALQHNHEQEAEASGEQVPPARLSRKRLGAQKKC